MSLNWKWEDKFAIATYDDGDGTTFTRNWYEGNAWMIETHEYEDDTYTVTSFWCDEKHMKRCLGISGEAGFDSVYAASKYKPVKVRIAKGKTTHFKKIVPALAQAFDDLTIEICTEL